MKITVLLLSVIVLFIGGADIFKQMQKRISLDEIVRFVMYVRGELHYRSPDLESLFASAGKQNYSTITFGTYSADCGRFCDIDSKKDFNEFISRLGTTDSDGQLKLCDEYYERFSVRLSDLRLKEKSKVQTSAALSILASICVLVLAF